MKAFLYLSGIFVFFLSSCANNEVNEKKSPSTKATDVIAPDSVVDRNTGDNVVTNVQVDSVIHIAFPEDSVSVTVQGQVSKKGEPVICMLPISIGKKLTARITAENKNAEIRFSHIDFPDGSADGPFGNFLEYDLKQKGMHKLYIASNMMAGDPVNTGFMLRVTVQ